MHVHRSDSRRRHLDIGQEVALDERRSEGLRRRGLGDGRRAGQHRRRHQHRDTETHFDPHRARQTGGIRPEVVHSPPAGIRHRDEDHHDDELRAVGPAPGEGEDRVEGQLHSQRLCDAGHHEQRDTTEGEGREARDQRRLVFVAQTDDQQHQTTEPHTHGQNMGHVERDAHTSYPTGAGVTGHREGEGEEHRRHCDSQPPRPSTMKAQSRHEAARGRGHDQANDHPRPVAGAGDGAPQARVEDAPKGASGRVRTLERERGGGGQHQHEPGEPHDATSRPLLRASGPHDREEHEAADEAGEPHEPHEARRTEQWWHAPVPASERLQGEGVDVDLVAGHHDEAERALGRMGIGRDHPPGDDVRAVGESGHRGPNPRGVAVHVLRCADGHVVALLVEQGDASEAHLHLLVELEDDLGRRRVEHRRRIGLAALERRVGERGRRRQRQHGDNGSDCADQPAGVTARCGHPPLVGGAAAPAAICSIVHCARSS